FHSARCVALARDVWCPFNSQNTAWFPEAYRLMYLPAYCSFRMTDIWRSFVAQAICRVNGWHLAFHQATVSQERHADDLMSDFAQEVTGYLNNEAMIVALAELDLRSGPDAVGDNMLRC